MTSPVPPLHRAVEATTAARPPVARHWALFDDWCTATGRCSLPATPDTVAAFLAEVPAGPATVRRRIRAIDSAHASAGLVAPGASPPLDGLGHPAKLPRFDPDLIAAALRRIPVGGWPTGMIRRRDAALVALVCSAGMTRRQVQALTANSGAAGRDDHTVIAHTATTSPMVGERAIPPMARSGDPGSCPACAVTRWQRVAAATATHGWRIVRNQLADLGEIPAGTETDHDCARPITWPPVGVPGPVPQDVGNPGTNDQAAHNDSVALFPAIDRHGAPTSTQSLSLRSITTIVTARLAVARSHDDPSTLVDFEGATPRAPRRRGDEDHVPGMAKRQQAMNRLAGFEALLDEADAYAEAVLQRLENNLAADHPHNSGEGEPSDRETR